MATSPRRQAAQLKSATDHARWGVEPQCQGKVVWFELPRGA